VTQARLVIATLCLAAGCRTRLLASPEEAASPPDLSRGEDLYGARSGLTAPDLALSDCPAESRLIYVIDWKSNMLSSFRPDTLEFRDVGVLACPAPPDYAPVSMAVQRDGTAWVEYSDLAHPLLLFRSDIRTAACDPTSHAPGGGMMGMAVAVEGNVETLYVLSGWRTSASALDTLDLTTSRSRASASSAAPAT